MKRNIKIKIPGLGESVSGIIQLPDIVKSILILAHGAGVGMTHPFMESLAQKFEDKHIGTLRFQFPYMEKGIRRPDRPVVAHQAVEAAYQRGLQYGKKYEVPVYVGGKSFGGRMTSQLKAENGLTGCKGLVFFGFPLHAPGRHSIERAEHLKNISTKMLFHQGTRDTLAEMKLIQKVLKGLKKVKLHVLEGADHGFKTLKSSGVTHDEVLDSIVKESVKFLK